MSSSKSAPSKSNQSLLSTPLHGLYIPVGLLVVGVGVIDYNYIPHAVAVAVILGAFKVFRGRGLHLSPPLFFSVAASLNAAIDFSSESRVILKPDVFQDFELAETTVVSHNVGMYGTRSFLSQLLPPANNKPTATVSTSPAQTTSLAFQSANTFPSPPASMARRSCAPTRPSPPTTTKANSPF